jgi:hypothetical protein
VKPVTGKVAALRRNEVLLVLQGGHELLAPSAAPLKELAEVGSEVLVYLNADRRLVGWYLPESRIGIDFRE